MAMADSVIDRAVVRILFVGRGAAGVLGPDRVGKVMR
jgi:hypothetical protein